MRAVIDELITVIKEACIDLLCVFGDLRCHSAAGVGFRHQIIDHKSSKTIGCSESKGDTEGL